MVVGGRWWLGVCGWVIAWFVGWLLVGWCWLVSRSRGRIIAGHFLGLSFDVCLPVDGRFLVDCRSLCVVCQELLGTTHVCSTT